jgi:geranylgeranyl pyrophosphate synthase
MATATGDLLFARAFAELARNDRVDEICVLSDASSALAAGELLQREDAWSDDVAVERYLRRCELKTARLFEAACRLGALEAGGPVEQLGAFGRGIGLAFQLLDDVLDVSGPAERTGKHRGTDLLDGTVTLPLILAREEDSSLAKIDLRELDADGAVDVCDRVAATGALERVRGDARGRVETAKHALVTSGLRPEQRQLLDLVADGVVERYS